VGQKVSLQLLSISSPNIDRFSKFFDLHTLWTTGNKVIIKYTITPELRRYTALWNTNFQKSL